MRGTVPGLAMPYPLRTLLPSVLQEDEFAVRWTAGLDDVLAPVVSTLDCLVAYLDPLTAPEDFLDWLADWLGIQLHEELPLARRRAAIAGAVPLHRVRGTLAGLRARLELVSGCPVEVADNGGVSWSSMPNSTPPGADQPWLAVRVAAVEGQAVDTAGLDELIRSEKPAHVPHQLEVAP
ncbi:MAG TPA: phage tail protein [Pseudonocardiaceae bacterium]|jgi:phage tail-like protein|nr:phage tail protein [Pseudonocardiaceae bacterium]